MKIVNIMVIQRNGFADTVSVTTDLPTTMPKVDDSPMYFTFNVECNKGEEYCKKHFPDVPIQLIRG